VIEPAQRLYIYDSFINAMQIIVKKAGSEVERRKKETAQEILRHYYGREIRDGSRFRTKSGHSKEQIKKVYEVR
jgi:hypothetical protein